MAIARPIPEFPGYYVTACGVVSSERKVLSQCPTRRGYYRVWLYRNKKRIEKSVHQCVALAWVDGDNSLTVNHKDGDKTNNHADNLEWITNRDNIIHSFASSNRDPNKTWETRRKKSYGMTSITDSDIAEIYSMSMRGETKVAIAKKLGIHRKTVASALSKVKGIN